MEYFLPISALQHYAFCPRQFALIHVEQAWEENYFTADGRLLHERVDTGEAEQRGNMRYERSVLLVSKLHKIQGKMDLLEIDMSEDQLCYLPVEYKRGKPKIKNWDKIQLCAQALCLEEMRNMPISRGAIWYWEVRHRESVIIDEALRQETITTIQDAHAVLRMGKTPEPTRNKALCRACSLNEICKPKTFRHDQSKRYIDLLFNENSDK